MKNVVLLILATSLALSLLTVPACRQQPQTRQYEENEAAAAATVDPGQTNFQEANWRWEKPLRWSESESEGMRLATFAITELEGTGQCTLVPLSGNGGGVRANVQRWLEQLQLPSLSEQELADFLGRQKKMKTKNGLPLQVIDFTDLDRTGAPSRSSILAAIILAEDQTLFVKLSGAKALLEKNREVFYEFCRSLSLGA